MGYNRNFAGVTAAGDEIMRPLVRVDEGNRMEQSECREGGATLA
jgi:hypothetical protein